MAMKKVIFVISVVFCLVLFTTGRCFANALLEQAIEYQKNKDYESAERLYQQIIISDYPQNDFVAMRAHEKLAIVYITTERDADAQAMVDELTAGFADAAGLPKAFFNIARTFERHQTRKYDAATELYQRLIERWPDDAEAGRAALRLARMDVLSLIASGQDSEAQEKLDSLLINFSGQEADLPQVIYDAARAYEREPRRKYDAANEIYQQVIQQYSDSPQAGKAQLDILKLQILCYIRDGNDIAAQAVIDNLCAAFSDHPDLPRVLYRIARRYESSGEYEHAQTIYQQIIQQYSDSLQAGKVELDIPKAQILSLIADGNDAAAQQALDRLIVNFNENVYLAKAISNIEEGYYNKILAAEAPLREDYSNAIKVWEKVTAEFPDFFYDSPDLYYFIACCYYRLGDYENAVDYYRRVVENWPDSKKAQGTLALNLIDRSYQRLVNSAAITQSQADARIEQFYTEIIENYPYSESAKYICLKLGREHFDSGRWVDAARYFEQFWQNFPDDPQLGQVVYDLGTAYEKMGQTALAVVVYEEFLKTHPTDQRIKARIEELRIEN